MGEEKAQTIATGRLLSSNLTDQQLQRAWALGYVKLTWPNIDPSTAERLARWIANGATS